MHLTFTCRNQKAWLIEENSFYVEMNFLDGGKSTAANKRFFSCEGIGPTIRKSNYTAL